MSIAPDPGKVKAAGIMARLLAASCCVSSVAGSSLPRSRMSTITVLSSLATREAYLELVPQFEAQSGHKVETTWAGTVNITKRMADGEVFDLVISSSGSIKELAAQGKIVAGSATNLSKTGIGIGV